MVAFGRMRLNGYNISLASLSGGDPATGSGVTNCMVYNFNTTNAATLSIGKDNSSTAFNGMFADGTNQPLGLTKIGSGTLTLSGDSTNSGPVTVSAGHLGLVVRELEVPAHSAMPHCLPFPVARHWMSIAEAIKR